ncbi:MAG: HK97 family phage prohead protease [bacterium]
MNKKELRFADINDSKDDLIVEGYAAVFEKETVLFSCGDTDYKEIIDRNAFLGADLSDVVFKYNHSNDFLVLARTSNNTLQLSIDEMGLKMTANLADVQTGRDLYSLIKRRDINKMSFAFTVREESYDTKTHTRRILKFDKIYDVSAVDIPAYNDTIITARDYFKAQNDLRQKLILLTY